MQPKERKCANKMAFDTNAEAQTAVTVTEYQRGNTLKVYRCRDCQLWHLSSKYTEEDEK